MAIISFLDLDKETTISSHYPPAAAARLATCLRKETTQIQHEPLITVLPPCFRSHRQSSQPQRPRNHTTDPESPHTPAGSPPHRGGYPISLLEDLSPPTTPCLSRPPPTPDPTRRRFRCRTPSPATSSEGCQTPPTPRYSPPPPRVSSIRHILSLHPDPDELKKYYTSWKPLRLVCPNPRRVTARLTDPRGYNEERYRSRRQTPSPTLRAPPIIPL